MENEPKISIYVCHHKPSDLISDSSYIPIHVGAKASPYRLDMVRDDSGENISQKNSSYCEMTAIYWAWKNDTDSDWIGLMHYRRFLAFESTNAEQDEGGLIRAKVLDSKTCLRYGISGACVHEAIQRHPDAKAILPKKWSVKSVGQKSLISHYAQAPFHYEKDLALTREAIGELFPEDVRIFDAAMQEDHGYFTNIFVFRRELFLRYCEWIFPILEYVEKKIDTTNYSSQARRVIGYLAERLINVFLLKEAGIYGLSAIEFPRLFIEDTNASIIDSHLHRIPITAPEENSISVVSVSDDNYVPHLAAFIESVKESVATYSPQTFLELFILDGGISSTNRKLLTRQFQTNLQRGNIVFLECANLYASVEAHTVFTNATFFRLSLGRLLPNHKRVLYVDSDTIVLGNLMDIWSIDLAGKAIAAVPDVIMKSFIRSGTVSMREAGGMPAGDYLSKKLGMGQASEDYFQAGVILFDLDKIRELNLEERTVRDLRTDTYWFLDQDVLNMHLVGNVKFMDTAWNCVNVALDVSHNLSAEWGAKLREDLNAPKIIHYAGAQAKPWNTRSAPWANAYWYFLRRTFWYENVLLRYEPRDTVSTALQRSMLYRAIRKVWRTTPNSIKRALWPLSRWYVSKHN